MSGLTVPSPGFVTVSVRQGALRGRRRRTPAGSTFLSFQGVPYAQPPLGHRRFKAPLPAESWTGIRDATKEGNVSVQYDPLSKKVLGDEDCLFLNVYTPRLPTGEKNEKLRAVLVHIHGGAFTVGSSTMYGPEPLMDRDVVLVTLNYRLGPLGFLSLGTREAPGNAGLKDQAMALRWVKENISLFGGDPNNVTIFGESAGATSVHYQVLSPQTKGLFRRAIAQSGTALLPWALARDPVGRAVRLALAAGCDWDTTEQMGALLKWLRAAPASQLVRVLQDAKSAEERRRNVLALFVPCVEPDDADAFLTEEPAELLAKGAAQRVPIVFGLTSHEGMLLLPRALFRLGMLPPPESVVAAAASGDPAAAQEAMEAAEAEALAEIAADLERLVPEELLAGRKDLERSLHLIERVKDFFFDGKTLSTETLEGFIHINSDVFFGRGVMSSARAHARLGSPVFLYEFDFQGLHNFLARRIGSPVAGACHGDDVGYLFAIPGVPEPEKGSREELVKTRMGRLWTDFAKLGNPTPSIDEVITTTWLPFSESTPNFLRISEDLKAETSLLSDRMEFWDDLSRK